MRTAAVLCHEAAQKAQAACQRTREQEGYAARAAADAEAAKSHTAAKRAKSAAILAWQRADNHHENAKAAAEEAETLLEAAACRERECEGYARQARESEQAARSALFAAGDRAKEAQAAFWRWETARKDRELRQWEAAREEQAREGRLARSLSFLAEQEARPRRQ